MMSRVEINPHISGHELLRLLQICFLFVTASVPGANSDTDPSTGNVKAIDRLHAGLFLNYNKNIQPQFEGVPTPVGLGVTITYLDVEEMSGKLNVHCWQNIRWRDEMRMWKPSEYDNITEIALRTREVWKPDIQLMDGNDGGQLDDNHVVLTHDGHFQWTPAAIYVAYCNLNMINWPHDQQTCKLKIGSWGLKDIKSDVNFMGKGDTSSSKKIDSSVPSTEWEIVESSAKFVSQDYYGYMEYTLTIQRESSIYKAIIYTPASCIVILALAAFWLPPHMGGEKILINGLLIIVIAAFLMYFAQLLPIVANKTPLVVLFYSTTLLFLSFSTIIEVAVLYLATAKHKRRIPDVLKKLLHGKVGTWLLLSQFCVSLEPNSDQTKEMDEHLYENGKDADDDATNPLDINPNEVSVSRMIQFDWVLLATAVDRVFFVVFSLAFMTLAIICAV